MTDYKKHPKADEREDAAKEHAERVLPKIYAQVREALVFLAAQHKCHLTKFKFEVDITFDHVPGMEDDGCSNGAPALSFEETQA